MVLYWDTAYGVPPRNHVDSGGQFVYNITDHAIKNKIINLSMWKALPVDRLPLVQLSAAKAEELGVRFAMVAGRGVGGRARFAQQANQMAGPLASDLLVKVTGKGSRTCRVRVFFVVGLLCWVCWFGFCGPI